MSTSLFLCEEPSLFAGAVDLTPNACLLPASPSGAAAWVEDVLETESMMLRTLAGSNTAVSAQVKLEAARSVSPGSTHDSAMCGGNASPSLAAQAEAMETVHALYAAPTVARHAVRRRVAATTSEDDDDDDDDGSSFGAQVHRRAPRRTRGAASASSAACERPTKRSKPVSAASLTEEERVLRRRLKNREASQMSRDRKRQRLEVLEAEVNEQKAIVASVSHERDMALLEVQRLNAMLAQLQRSVC